MFYWKRRGCRFKYNCRYSHDTPYILSYRAREQRRVQNTSPQETQVAHAHKQSPSAKKTLNAVTKAVTNSLIELVKDGCVKNAAHFVSAVHEVER